MCVSPLKGYRDSSGALFFWAKDGTIPLRISCGQCWECRLAHAREWAGRCVAESQLRPFNSFITLTYRDNPVSLEYRDFQLFMKRLRKWYGGNVRFFMCGEYGDKKGRPHFHAILFGVRFPDQVKRGKYSYSKKLDELWGHGDHNAIGDVTFESAEYVAGYVFKKLKTSGPFSRVVLQDSGEYAEVTPEFCHMSLKPGIGADWLKLYRKNVFPAGRMHVRGKFINSPSYFDLMLRRFDREAFDALKEKRVKQLLELTLEQRVERGSRRCSARKVFFDNSFGRIDRSRVEV